VKRASSNLDLYCLWYLQAVSNYLLLSLNPSQFKVKLAVCNQVGSADKALAKNKTFSD
jgi:hypothetical protein